MKPQEIFDTVARHLLTQMERAADSFGCCSYRTDDGLKCAIGCLFADSEYESEMEGWDIDDLISGELMPKRLRSHKQLLCSLQCVHDGYGVREWPDLLRRVAKAFQLSAKCVDEFDSPRPAP